MHRDLKYMGSFCLAMFTGHMPCTEAARSGTTEIPFSNWECGGFLSSADRRDKEFLV